MRVADGDRHRAPSDDGRAPRLSSDSCPMHAMACKHHPSRGRWQSQTATSISKSAMPVEKCNRHRPEGLTHACSLCFMHYIYLLKIYSKKAERHLCDEGCALRQASDTGQCLSRSTTAIDRASHAFCAPRPTSDERRMPVAQRSRHRKVSDDGRSPRLASVASRDVGLRRRLASARG